MKKAINIIFFIIFVSLNSIGQGEYNNWVFGNGIRLDFNSTPPVVNSANCNGSMAFSSISDPQGNLLFYTDVDINPPITSLKRGNVYNSSNLIMQNGDSLFGQHFAQCTNILPVPCNDSLYYVFNLSKSSNLSNATMNLYYSMVNINGFGGLGTVLQKNILLDSNLAIGFAITRHGNNTDYWISYKKVHSNIHVQRVITTSGIGLPVFDTIGTIQHLNTSRSTIKFSPDGTKMVNCIDSVGLFDVYEFNNLTGTFSNPMFFVAPSNLLTSIFTNPSFSQFSPDMNRLYVTGGTYLLQYDFSSGNSTTILNSVIPILSNWGALLDISLGPDQVIYITRSGGFLGGIEFPNSLGSLCTFHDTIVTTGTATYIGLPTMLPNLFVHRDVLSDSLLCQYDTVNLYLSDTNFIDSVVWNFGDTTSGVLNTSTDVIPLHVFNTYGNFPIEAIVYSGCVNDTIHDTIRISPTPIAILGPDTILCEGDSMQLLFNDTSFNYLWNTGDTTLSIQIWDADTFWVELSSVCGIDRDSIVIDSIIPAYVHFPNDTLICEGDSLFLDATVQNGTYLWSTGDTVSSLWVDNPGGTFWVQTVNICNADSDTIVIDFTHAPNINLGNDSILCSGDSLVLDAWDTLSAFLWSTGDTVSNIVVDTSGIYFVSTTNLCGADSDSVELWFIDPPTVSLANDTILCPNATIVLRDTSSAFPMYAWNNGSTLDSALVAYPGVYALTVTNVCGVASDTVEVWYDNSPITNLGTDARYCITNLVNIDAYWSRATYLWNTADTTHDINANYSGQYSVQVTNLCGYDDDTVNIAYDMPISFNLGGDTVMCAGDSISLSAPAHNANWTWQNGSTDSTFVVNQSGTYWVSAHNFCGTYSDTVHITGETLPLISKPINDTAICSNEEFVVNVPKNNATSILWNDGSNDYQRTFATTNDYSYQLFNICGKAIDTFKVVVEHPLEFGLGNDTIICYGEEFTKVLDHPLHTYLWNNGSTENFHTITRTGVYGVTIWTPAHCESYDEFEVTNCNSQLFIPNAFTPGNGDEHNNTFQVQGVGIKKYNIFIYDRWGQQVFESRDIDISWDGTFNWQNSEAGVYSYKIWYNTGENSESVIKQGTITLIR